MVSTSPTVSTGHVTIKPDHLTGLYAITDSALIPADQLYATVEKVISGGATMVQFRDKYAPPAERLQQAQTVLELCRARSVPLIINDDVELARKIGAHGVHLGRADLSLTDARDYLGRSTMVGLSCYASIARALAAQAAGADYVAFGRFFPSKTKPLAKHVDLSILSEARQQLTLPIVAIGGITAENGQALLTAGADMLAVIHDLFGHADPCQAAERYKPLFEKN
ncbi:MAG: thiamine phosphate synthase [Gammaproteobacteria bacterium]|nr:thiamine phosphate synthase [Gammaproteobacteria bacterium]